MTIEELCKRVFVGRRELLRLNLGRSLNDIQIAIGPQVWHDIVNEYRDLLEAENRYTLHRVDTGPLEQDGPMSFRIYGITAHLSNDLGPDDVCFRSEVTL